MQHSSTFLALVAATMPRVKEISVAELRRSTAAKEPFSLLDVREDHEWAGGHIPGAEHLGRGILERDIETRFPDLNAPLILYCGGGYRSALAADSLQNMGYKNVRSLAGGWKSWKAGN